MPNKLSGATRRASPSVARRLRALRTGSTLMTSSARFDDDPTGLRLSRSSGSHDDRAGGATLNSFTRSLWRTR